MTTKYDKFSLVKSTGMRFTIKHACEIDALYPYMTAITINYWIGKVYETTTSYIIVFEHGVTSDDEAFSLLAEHARQDIHDRIEKLNNDIDRQNIYLESIDSLEHNLHFA